MLPACWSSSRGAVLVAHNAPFDVGFLRAACARHGYAWPRRRSLCTVRLARAVLTREEAPELRLGALARLFGTATTPNHRALADARATVDVLHPLLERVGNVGRAQPGGAARRWPRRGCAPAAQRRKRHLADARARRARGVPVPRAARRGALRRHGGDLRRRVRSYFTAAEKPRPDRARWWRWPSGSTHVECAHALEAEVRELRLIAAHQPPLQPALARPRPRAGGSR